MYRTFRYPFKIYASTFNLAQRINGNGIGNEKNSIPFIILPFENTRPTTSSVPFSRSSLATTTRQKVQSAKKGAKKGESATGRVSIFHAISKLASVTRFAELSLQRIEDPKGERRDASSSTLRRRDSNIGCQMAPARRQIFRFEASLSLSTGR